MSMSIFLSQLFNRSRWKYQWCYLRGKTPWESGSTPPQLMDFIDTHPPGKAIDLGCGTGIHALALAEKGWDVTGIDYVPGAIRIARRKAAGKGVQAVFVHGDVTCPGGWLDGQYDLALDIGCRFALESSEQAAYSSQLARLLSSCGGYLLFAWLRRFVDGRPRGILSERVDMLMLSKKNHIHSASYPIRGGAFSPPNGY